MFYEICFNRVGILINIEAASKEGAINIAKDKIAQMKAAEFKNKYLSDFSVSETVKVV